MTCAHSVCFVNGGGVLVASERTCVKRAGGMQYVVEATGDVRRSCILGNNY